MSRRPGMTGRCVLRNASGRVRPLLCSLSKIHISLLLWNVNVKAKRVVFVLAESSEQCQYCMESHAHLLSYWA